MFAKLEKQVTQDSGRSWTLELKHPTSWLELLTGSSFKINRLLDEPQTRGTLNKAKRTIGGSDKRIQQTSKTSGMRKLIAPQRQLFLAQKFTCCSLAGLKRERERHFYRFL